MLRYAFVPAKGTWASFLDTHMDALPCQVAPSLSYDISWEEASQVGGPRLNL